MRPFLLFALVAVAPLAAQDAPVQVDPGMTRAQVIERLGRPATERSSGEFTYLFFINGCERTCGMNDLVTLRSDTVVDAIFRTAKREYTGRSTSPAQTRSQRNSRGSLNVTPPRTADSVVMRIVPADPNAPPPESRPIGDLTGRTIVPGARPDSLRGTRLPADAATPLTPGAPQRPAVTAQPETPVNAQPVPPVQPAAPVNAPAIRPDTTRNTSGTRADTTRGDRIPVTRSDTVVNPRTPVTFPRPDSAARPPANRPPTQPPPTQPPPPARPSP